MFWEPPRLADDEDDNLAPSHDHRDVINSILLTAMCYENLKDYDKAEFWYQAVLTEYSYSRYVGEALVKIARMSQLRMKSLQEDSRTNEQRRNESFAFMKKSLQYYSRAIREDPYSTWADTAAEEMAKLEKTVSSKAQSAPMK